MQHGGIFGVEEYVSIASSIVLRVFQSELINRFFQYYFTSSIYSLIFGQQRLNQQFITNQQTIAVTYQDRSNVGSSIRSIGANSDISHIVNINSSVDLSNNDECCVICSMVCCIALWQPDCCGNCDCNGFSNACNCFVCMTSMCTPCAHCVSLAVPVCSVLPICCCNLGQAVLRSVLILHASCTCCLFCFCFLCESCSLQNN